MSNHILKYGLILGCIQGIITFTLYIVDTELFLDWKVGIITILLSLIVTIYSGISFRKSQSGYIDLKSAFLVVWGVFVASSFVGLAFRIVLFNLVDPDLSVYLQERTIETTVDMLERFGAPDSTIEETVIKLEDTNQFSIASLLQGFGWTFLLSAIPGIIIAAIIKKNKPPFEEVA